MEYQGVEI